MKKLPYSPLLSSWRNGMGFFYHFHTEMVRIPPPASKRHCEDLLSSWWGNGDDLPIILMGTWQGTPYHFHGEFVKIALPFKLRKDKDRLTISIGNLWRWPHHLDWEIVKNHLWISWEIIAIPLVIPLVKWLASPCHLHGGMVRTSPTISLERMTRIPP